MLLEYQNKRGAKEETILSEWQRDHNADIGVREINSKDLSVKLNHAGVELDLLISVTNVQSGGSSPTIAFDRASLQSAIELYQQFSLRAALIWPQMPSATISFQSSGKSNDVAALIQKQFSDLGLVCINDGDSFVMIVPKEQKSLVKPHSPNPAVPVKKIISKDSSAAPEGVLALRNADVTQILEIYAQLLKTSFNREDYRRISTGEPITFSTPVSLSKDEAIYALETMLEWRHVKVYRDSDGSCRVKSSLEEKPGR